MSDDSLTARNRINQRNFRARRQNYIKELEERIRKYELEGVQATIEVQAAARQVTDQNNKLRNLLVQRYGMSDYDIANYLGFPQQSPSVHGQPFANVFATNPQLASLAPAPASGLSGGLAPKPSASMDATQSYPTPPQQHDPPRVMSSSLLDPALSLASLHKFPSTNHDSIAFSDPTSSRHNSNHSITHTMDNKSSPWESIRPDSPTDTLSESSNPATPAEQPHVDNSRPNHPRSIVPAGSHSQSVSKCCKSTPSQPPNGRNPRPNDETACEEAARIIASMRGGGSEDTSPDQVMLELGCSSPNEECKVKNLSIFQLMDRG